MTTTKEQWRKLDNTAKIFSLDDKKNTSMFRYSVLLKKDVDPNALQKAVNESLKYLPSYKVKKGTGLFWNYIETNNKKIKIEEESEIPCEHINLRKNNNYLFKVTYYKNKINLDVFHILTDAVGATLLLKIIIYNYLRIKYKINIDIEKENEISNYNDLYLKYCDINKKDTEEKTKAYQLPGIPNNKVNNTYHYIVSVKELKKITKKHKVTITEYLTAMYMYSIYKSLYNNKSSKEIVVAIPINLRRIYNEETTANFFTYMSIKSNVVGKDKVTFTDILNEVHKEYQNKLTKDKIDSYLARDVRIGTKLSIRLVPLFIKKLFIKYFGYTVKGSITTMLSNVGYIEIDNKLKKYIDNILVIVMPNKLQKVKCTVCSYEDKLNITINSNIRNKLLPMTFLNLLNKQLKNVKVETNK